MKKAYNSRDEKRVAENNPAKRMEQQSGDDQFPGYPHYDRTEDMMDSRSDAERVNVDVEQLPSFHNNTTSHRLNPTLEENGRLAGSPTDRDDNIAGDGMEDELEISMGTEADVTPEERQMLEDDMYYPTQDEDRLRQARLDDRDFDGEKLNEESFGIGQTASGDGLDMDDQIEDRSIDALGQDDEENQYYSLGSDANDNIVEGTP